MGFSNCKITAAKIGHSNLPESEKLNCFNVVVLAMMLSRGHTMLLSRGHTKKSWKCWKVGEIPSCNESSTLVPVLYIYATSPFNSLQLWPGIPVVYLWYHWSLFIHILTCNISGKSRQVPIPTFCLQQILNGISQKYQAAGQELVQNILLRFCTTRPGVGTSDLHPEAGQWGPELSKIKSSCLAHLWMSIEINLGSSDWLILLVTVPQSFTVGTTHCLPWFWHLQHA